MDITRETFINLYPYLPYQIDLCIDIVSGLRLRRGAQRHIGGSNRTIIKQAQQMLVHPQTNLAVQPIGSLVTLDLVYELLYAGNLLPTEVTREIDDVPSRLPHDAVAHKVAKAVALLEAVTDLPRSPRNLAAVLHPRIDADSQLSERRSGTEVVGNRPNRPRIRRRIQTGSLRRDRPWPWTPSGPGRWTALSSAKSPGWAVHRLPAS